MLKNIVA